MGKKAAVGMNEIFTLADQGWELTAAWEKMGQPTTWGNVVRRYNEHKKHTQEKPTPATPAEAQKADTTKKKADPASATKTGKSLAKTVYKPTRIVAEEERRKRVWHGRTNRQLWLANTDWRRFQLASPCAYDAWAAAERVRASGEGVLGRDRIRRAALQNRCTQMVVLGGVGCTVGFELIMRLICLAR
jgi:hypothetical protein